jgi:hypothetical protein
MPRRKKREIPFLRSAINIFIIGVGFIVYGWWYADKGPKYEMWGIGIIIVGFLIWLGGGVYFFIQATSAGVKLAYKMGVFDDKDDDDDPLGIKRK